MKTAEVIFLTIITFGLYGAWWIYKNIYLIPTMDESLSDEERKALETQKALSSLWVMQTFHKS